MTQLSYGISKPADLLEKLILDGNRLTEKPNPHDVFNFVVTAAVLNEWVRKYYSKHPTVIALIDAQKDKDKNNNFEKTPAYFADWITNIACLPNKGRDPRRHIMNALSICWDTANASKHYHWADSHVTAFEDEPKINGFYQWFYTSVEPGLYIEYRGEYYTLSQLEGILIQFYSGLLHHLGEINR